jgi:hypothetical protein
MGTRPYVLCTAGVLSEGKVWLDRLCCRHVVVLLLACSVCLFGGRVMKHNSMGEPAVWLVK